MNAPQDQTDEEKGPPPTGFTCNLILSALPRAKVPYYFENISRVLGSYSDRIMRIFQNRTAARFSRTLREGEKTCRMMTPTRLRSQDCVVIPTSGYIRVLEGFYQSQYRSCSYIKNACIIADLSLDDFVLVVSLSWLNIDKSLCLDSDAARNNLLEGIIIIHDVFIWCWISFALLFTRIDAVCVWQ